MKQATSRIARAVLEIGRRSYRSVWTFVTARAIPITAALALGIFATLGYFSVFGLYLVPLGSILGILATAIAGIISRETPGRWMLVVVGTVFVGWFARYGAIQLQQARSTIDDDRRRALLTEQDLLEYVRNTPSEKTATILHVARRLRRYFRAHPPDIAHCDDLLHFLSQLDPDNGHTLYFRGEIERVEGKLRESRDDFFTYNEFADREERGAPSGSTSSDACYAGTTGERGYCRQRAGWVCHLLANELYREGCQAAHLGDRREKFESARKFADCALADFPEGFVQQISTSDLEGHLKAEVSNPAEACPAEGAKKGSD